MSMNQSLRDYAQQREAMRRGAEVFEAPKVKSLDDIRRLLVELDPTRSTKDVKPVKAQLVGKSSDGDPVKYALTMPITSQSKYSLLLDGFIALQTQQEAFEKSRTEAEPVLVNGREMRPVVPNPVSTHYWVDDVIARWLGATREGLFICWHMPGGLVYKYDIFQHRLFKATD